MGESIYPDDLRNISVFSHFQKQSSDGAMQRVVKWEAVPDGANASEGSVANSGKSAARND